MAPRMFYSLMRGRRLSFAPAQKIRVRLVTDRVTRSCRISLNLQKNILPTPSPVSAFLLRLFHHFGNFFFYCNGNLRKLCIL